MAKYPQQVLDSLHEYAERYKLNTKEYKDFIDNLGKIPNQLLEGVEIYNRGKTNLEKGSIVVIRVPTQKGIVTRAYIVLSGVPVTIDKETKIPMLDLHSYLVQEETPLESIKRIPTSDNTRDNKTNTEGMFFVTEDFLRRRKEALEKAEDISEPRKLTRKREPKKTEKKVEKKKKETKKEDIIEIPYEGEESKKRKKILDTAKKIKEDKLKEKEEEEIRRLEDAYTKIKAACIASVHNMGYTKREADNICDELEELIQEHAHSAVEKRSPTAVEEFAKLFVDKVIPMRVAKPKKEREAQRTPIRSEEEIIKGITYANPTGLLEMACLWIMGRYNQSTERSFVLCAERRNDIRRLARYIEDGKMDLIQATRELESIIVEQSKLTTVISGYKEARGKDAEEEIKLSEEKRRKVAGKAKEDLVFGAMEDDRLKSGYKARGELQRRTSERLEKIIGTSTKEISVQLKGKAAVIIEFQCYKATGLDKSGCYSKYIKEIASKYGFQLVEVPNGWAAHFSGNVLPGGNIAMVHYGKEYREFLKMIDKLKEEYEKPEHVLIWVNSFIDKSEYNRIL